MEKEGKSSEMEKENAPCGFDQTFSKFDAWFESMRGDGDSKETPKRAPRRGAMI